MQPATGVPGTGYQHRLVWEVAFRRQGEAATWQALVNARSGKVLEVIDRNYYVTAQVTGGIYPETNTDTEVVRGFPFNNVTNGSTKTTDANGRVCFDGLLFGRHPLGRPEGMEQRRLELAPLAQHCLHTLGQRRVRDRRRLELVLAHLSLEAAQERRRLHLLPQRIPGLTAQRVGF